MEGSERPQPKKPNLPREANSSPKKPLQVMHISRKEEQAKAQKESEEFLNSERLKVKDNKEDNFDEKTNYFKREQSFNFNISIRDFK